MILPIVSVLASLLALFLWLRVWRAWFAKRPQLTIKKDLADHLPMDASGLVSLILPRPIRRIYHFILVNLIPAFIGAWHVFQMTDRRNHPNFLEGYLFTLALFLLMLNIPAFFWTADRARRRAALEQQSNHAGTA